MPDVNVKGTKWAIESIDGNTVTLKNGQQIEVNDKTLAALTKDMPPQIPHIGALFNR